MPLGRAWAIAAGRSRGRSTVPRCFMGWGDVGPAWSREKPVEKHDTVERR